ncbi:MAG: ABC transporter permease [Dehalococcoidia bacterium]|nr:ABC transporter permease [Dehalococcoidia bacterium]
MIRHNIPQLVLTAFLLLMVGVTVVSTDIPLPGLVGNSLVRFFMNGVLVLSLVPMLNAGVGINYGLPVGILAGLLGMCIAVDLSLSPAAGFATSLSSSIIIGSVFGYGYARVLNRTKGEEEMTGLFFGFSAVFIMSFFWAVAPFGNPQMLWPIGGEGLRPSIGLEGHFSHILNDFAAFEIGGVQVPSGGLLFFGALCGLMFAFSRTKAGSAMSVVGENETFARFSGINIDRYRTLAIVLSTVLAAVGICVYTQSFGFLQLYDAPLMMAFPAASAILLGGSTGRNASIVYVLVGTFLFQTVYVFSGPLANALLVPEMTEIVRVTITSGVILYALLYQGGSQK